MERERSWQCLAVMNVTHKFAKHFGLEITNIIGSHYNGDEANPTKDAVLENSDFFNGMVMKDAIGVVIQKLEESGIGERKINYKMRDAAFSRQRYWGEPFPIIWKNGLLTRLMKKNCHWSCRMLNPTNRDLKAKGHWQICLNGFTILLSPEGGREEAWKPIPCPAMQAHPGIFFAIWTRIMKKNFATEKFLITGDRLIFILEEQNMQLAIYCTAACGRSFCMTVDGSVMMSHIKDW